MMADAPVALVTGAADGIGWATARHFADLGYRVAIADLRGGAAADRASALGRGHLGLTCDVTSEDGVERVVGQVFEAWGRIDVLVNNAGVGDQAPETLKQHVDAFDRVLAVHLRGTFLMSRACARHMVQTGSGAIVNIASIAALAGIPGRNAYGAGKAGIVAMTKSMGCEWAPFGVRVNAVAPGYIRTALVDRLEAEGALETSAILARTPMGRMGSPEDIAQAIGFLASAQAGFITGAVLSVDGGWMALGGAVPAVPPVVAAGDTA